MNVGPLPEHLRRVHMVGIGGAGMSGIARILLDRGAQVSGSDAKESRGVLALRARGALVNVGHDGEALDLLPGGPTVVVTTHAAIPKTNPELVEANRRGIPVLLRPVVLADLMAGYLTLMVTGTHGKTSTTSMLIVALQHCGYDPSFAVGGELNEAGTNAHHGSGDVFVAEADESDGSLLQYRPNLIVVTNIEADHLDHFGSVEAYIAVFDEFIETLGPEGILVVCLDDPGAAALARRAHERGVQVRGYGSGEQTDIPLAGRLRDWQFRDTGAIAQIQLAGEDTPRTMRLSVAGRHMALNALGAVVAATEIGAAVDDVLDGLAGFEGVRRRFELVGSVESVRVFDDYAHHPTEVRTVLQAVSGIVAQQGHGRSVVVFQPHLYSRTAAFATEFAEALSTADVVFVLDVYGAREQPLPGVSGGLIAEQVSGVPVHYLPDLSTVAEQVAAATAPGDLVVTMGAGDVTLQGKEIVRALRARADNGWPPPRNGQ
ncbi:MAG: UDP-N-acetylmuramate--L-alanine ligase [Mycobacterium sp.]